VFPPDSAARMRTIRAGLSIGFSVDELADIFREGNAGGAPCHRVRKLAGEKLALLEVKLRDLRNWRRELRSTLRAWDRRLSKVPLGKRARLLETMTHTKCRTRFPARALAKWEAV
jgi:DNA-binding transcriptional MerR regulator